MERSGRMHASGEEYYKIEQDERLRRSHFISSRDGGREEGRKKGEGVPGKEGKAQLVLFSCSCYGFQLLSIL